LELHINGCEKEATVLKPDTINDRYLVFIDLETGGLSPRRNPIIQLAAIAVNSALEPVEAIELKIQFRESQATKQSLRKTHYSSGLWAKDGVPPLEAARRLATFLSCYPRHTAISPSGAPYSVAQLVAHNAAFDGPFLQSWYQRLGLFLPARYQLLCTLQRAQWYFAEHPEETPPSSFKLAALCEYFRVPFHAANAHEALGDVTATLLLYRAMTHVDRGPQAQENVELMNGIQK
jgi:DNA polymerase III alpha subunit (gram-positive type)